MSEIKITQTSETNNVSDVTAELDHFWGQYWRRDPVQDNPDNNYQDKLVHLRNSLPAHIPPMQADQTDPALWIEAISATKRTSCPGADGVRASELQMLPPQAIQSLVDTVQNSPVVIPSDFMLGRTFPLQKR